VADPPKAGILPLVLTNGRMLVADSYDVVIIGAGHNGLVCACYLAAAGLTVKVVEQRSVVGGAAVAEEFHPGFRGSAADRPGLLGRCPMLRHSLQARTFLTGEEHPHSRS
jgi:thioredoxin reductase